MNNNKEKLNELKEHLESLGYRFTRYGFFDANNNNHASFAVMGDDIIKAAFIHYCADFNRKAISHVLDNNLIPECEDYNELFDIYRGFERIE